MYRIMLAKSKKENYGSLYQFLTSTVDGVTTPVEFSSEQALDTYVETMLNGSYSKSDFIIVQVMDYNIDAVIYEENEDPEVPEETQPTG